MKAGFYRLGGRVTHIFAHFEADGTHKAKATVYPNRRILTDLFRFVDYFPDGAEFRAAYPMGIITPSPLSMPSTRKEMELIRKKQMGGFIAETAKSLPKVTASPPLNSMWVDLGPLKGTPEAMSCANVRMAQETLTKQVQRTLQAWPYNGVLEFTLNNSQLEARWADKDRK